MGIASDNNNHKLNGTGLAICSNMLLRIDELFFTVNWSLFFIRIISLVRKHRTTGDYGQNAAENVISLTEIVSSLGSMNTGQFSRCKVIKVLPVFVHRWWPPQRSRERQIAIKWGKWQHNGRWCQIT